MLLATSGPSTSIAEIGNYHWPVMPLRIVFQLVEGMMMLEEQIPCPKDGMSGGKTFKVACFNYLGWRRSFNLSAGAHQWSRIFTVTI
jgi:hypothetical protein